MSGPKCSQFQLNEQRRLEELRKIEEQLRKEAEDREREEARQREEERKREEEIRRKEVEKRKKREADNLIYNAQMEERVAALKAKMLKKREQEIIAEAIDEAMVELGYDLIASIPPKEDAPVYSQAQVYSFSEGVGVQVIESEGRISMEVVGIGTNNRKPTDTECEYLEAQMVGFCDVYEELEEKLKEKGIVKTNTIRRFPPDKKYARILNVNQFTDRKESTTMQTVMKKQTKKSQISSVSGKKAQMHHLKQN